MCVRSPSCVIGLDLWALTGLIITKRLYQLIFRQGFQLTCQVICQTWSMKYCLSCGLHEINLSFTAFPAELWPLDMLAWILLVLVSPVSGVSQNNNTCCHFQPLALHLGHQMGRVDACTCTLFFFFSFTCFALHVVLMVHCTSILVHFQMEMFCFSMRTFLGLLKGCKYCFVDALTRQWSNCGRNGARDQRPTQKMKS